MAMLKYFISILQKIIAILFYDIKHLNWYTIEFGLKTKN